MTVKGCLSTASRTTESAIYDEIVNTYIADDCEAIEQWIYDVTNIKVEEK